MRSVAGNAKRMQMPVENARKRVLEEEVITTKQRTQFALLSLTVCVSAEGHEGSADACADTNTHTHTCI